MIVDKVTDDDQIINGLVKGGMSVDVAVVDHIVEVRMTALGGVSADTVTD